MNSFNSQEKLNKLDDREANGPEAVLYGLISKLITDKTKAFYGNLLQIFTFKFVKDGHKRPDFDVGLELEKDKIRFVINPPVFFKKDETEQEMRLIHELEHVLRNDVLFEPNNNPGYETMVSSFHDFIDTNGKKQSYRKLTPLAGLAMDLAINSLKFKEQTQNFEENTDFLLREGIFPSQHPFEQYPPYQTWEWYYEQMLDDAKNNRNGFEQADISIISNGKINSNLTNNSWNLKDIDGKTLSPADAENIKNFINSSIQNAIEETNRSAGKVPGRYQKYVDELKKIPFNWREKLDQFVFSGISPVLRSSKRKISRRARALGCIAPGVIGKPDVCLWTFIDVSGSISQKEFENAIGHVNKIRESTKSSVWISNFDATVQDTFVLEDNNYKEILKTKVSHTKGGTCFAPIFDAIRSEKKFKPDVVLIFTDGFCFDTFDEIKRLRLMWVLTENHQRQPFGQHLIMKEYF
jgi:predicted metal-dependent peptidase